MQPACGRTDNAAIVVEEGPELSERERRVLDYIIAFTTRNFFQPSVREVCEALEIPSTKTVAEVIQSLTAKGYVAESHQRGARSLALVGVEITITRRLVPPTPQAGSGAQPTARE